MCGIVGVLDAGRSRSAEGLAGTVAVMTASVRHRGPDDEGTWLDAEAGIGLGHRRLSIVDLSQCGHQPMESPSGRWITTYNGEIYNAEKLRARLEAAGQRFRGHSDTEVLMAALDHWGLDEALDRVNGMFALALWDRERRELHLVRDRVGEKPLFYGWAGDALVFGSELRALCRHAAFDRTVDRGALALYLRHNCVPAPHSVFRDAAKVLPGEHVTVDATGVATRRVHRAAYWSARAVAEAGCREPLPDDRAEIVDRLGDLLRDAVQLRMTADVPVGAFLSGGIDSSLVTALMQAAGRGRVRTFTIGFDDPAYDESRDAARVAAHLGTDHTELRLGAADVLALVPELPELYDEPFADSSQIPTALVSRLARRDVTVALSGDGGDELFAGYNRHLWCERITRRLRPVPMPVRRGAAAALGRLSPAATEAVFRRAAPLLPARWRVRNPSIKIAKLADVLALRSIDDMYRTLVSHWPDPESVVPGAVEATSRLDAPEDLQAAAGPVERMLYLDLVTYLPDDILTKVDRATMAVGLEGRMPLLDPRVVELAWRIPTAAKMAGGQAKWPLRALLGRHVPLELFDRPKMGFGLPLGDWLRGPLRPWVEELLDGGRLRREGFFDPIPIRRAWEEHRAGRADRSHALWDVLMFEAWRDRWAASSG